MKTVIIELPGIKAVSRNQTTGHFIKYHKQLTLAEQWMMTYGKAKEYHFEKQVDVTIVAYYDTRGHNKCADSANIDDKIFTDTLIRYKPSKEYGKIPRAVWFIEDDKGKYLRYVHKLAVPSDHYKVVITITEVEDPYTTWDDPEMQPKKKSL